MPNLTFILVLSIALSLWQFRTMEAIANWLKNKDYQEGVSLYNLHGSSDFLKKIFESGEGDYTRQKLEEELTALLPKDSTPRWRDLEYKETDPRFIIDKTRFADHDYYKRQVLGSWPPEEDPKEPSKLNGRELDVIYIDEGVNIPYKEKQPSNQDNIQYLKLIRRRNDLNRQITRNMALLDASTSKARRFETAKQIKSLDRAKRVV